MRTSPTIRPAATLAIACMLLPLACWGQSKKLSGDEIVERMQRAETELRDHSVAYTVTREYQLSAADAKQPSSDVVAQVNFVPPTTKDYTIVSSQGSDRGTGIVRKVLDREAELATQHQLHAITSRNYAFALVGRESTDGHDCYLLQLIPRRQAAELIRGQAWVDVNSFVIRQIHGDTAKNPSLWISNLNLTINYGEVNGVWLQTSSRAVADVRFMGPHVLTSRDLSVHPVALEAGLGSPSRIKVQPTKGRHVVADPAAWIAR